MPLISLDRVSKTFRLGDQDVRAVQDISLNVSPGEFVAIMGPSGSGKSTLMNIIGLLDRPTNGTYVLDGQAMDRRMSDGRLAKLRGEFVGFIFQTFNLLPNLNVLDNVALPAMYTNKSKNPRPRAKQLLQQVGLSHRLKHRPTELSGGERQRVAIARALMNNPKVVLADEPTGNLDSKSGADIVNILQQLNREGTTLLLVTHNEELAKRANRIIHLTDGRLQS
ncbi:MAG: ABC transporter ATP-binding protein [Patescibacteria group bacterium]